MARRGRRPNTDKVDARLVARMHKQGQPSTVIAKAAECHPRTVQRILRTLGYTQPQPDRNNRPLAPEMHRAIEAMLDDGASFYEISRTLGVGDCTLRKHYPGRAWDAQQVGQHGAAIRRANMQMAGLLV